MSMSFIVITQYCDESVHKKNLTAFVYGHAVCKEEVELFFEPEPYFFVDAVAYAGAFDIAFDKAGAFELFKVLRYGGLGQSQLFYQVVADTGILPDDVLQDGNTGRVGQGLEHGSYLVLLVGKYFGPGYAHYIAV